MADKFLNETGLQIVKQWIEGKFALDSDLDNLETEVQELISEGGEPNKINSITVNGTPVNPDSNKNVALTVPNATSELTNNGDGDSPFATEDYVDTNGGKIDTISVNNTPQTITNKNVNITVPTTVAELSDHSDYALASSVPKKVSDITNDSGFQTEAEVQALIDAELADITGIDFQVVTELPESGVKGTIYLLHRGGASTDIYDEYVWLTPEGGTAHWEQIGNTEVDLSGYWSKTELQAMTVAEINAILNPGS